MTGQRKYATPEAARRAVTDQLRTQSAAGGWPLADLQRQYAYDQLVERLYQTDATWVIKGATALLARRISVRHTIDIDILRDGAIREAEEKLRSAAGLDIGDWMLFEVGPATPLRASGAPAVRVRVKSFIGTKVWAPFQIDLVAGGVRMTGSPDAVAPLTEVNIAATDRTMWRAYPLSDHVADKICAILERHDGNPSTRFKDLVDLVAIATRSAGLEATAALTALQVQSDRRQLALPAEFDVPDPAMWERGYRAEARRTVGLAAPSMTEALAIVRPMVEPLLSGTATGTWDPAAHSWLV